MCEKCYNAAKKYYPDLSDHELGDLLMGATAFPIADADYVVKQIKEVRNATDGTLNQALRWADQQLTKQMETLRVGNG